METILEWISDIASINDGILIVQIVLVLCFVYIAYYVLKNFGILDDLYHYFCDEKKDDE